MALSPAAMPVTTAVCTPVASRSVSPVLSSTARTASTAVTTARTRIAFTSMWGLSFAWGSGAEGAGDSADDTAGSPTDGDSGSCDTEQPVSEGLELVDPGLQLDHVGSGDLVVELGVHLCQLIFDLSEDVLERPGDGRLGHRRRSRPPCCGELGPDDVAHDPVQWRVAGRGVPREDRVRVGCPAGVDLDEDRPQAVPGGTVDLTADLDTGGSQRVDLRLPEILEHAGGDQRMPWCALEPDHPHVVVDLLSRFGDWRRVGPGRGRPRPAGELPRTDRRAGALRRLPVAVLPPQWQPVPRRLVAERFARRIGERVALAGEVAERVRSAVPGRSPVRRRPHPNPAALKPPSVRTDAAVVRDVGPPAIVHVERL